ncbi:hypothetical protein GCM10027187_14320 [Streptosporangium sandarakinum]
MPAAQTSSAANASALVIDPPHSLTSVWVHGGAEGSGDGDATGARGAVVTPGDPRPGPAVPGVSPAEGDRPAVPHAASSATSVTIVTNRPDMARSYAPPPGRGSPSRPARAADG